MAHEVKKIFAAVGAGGTIIWVAGGHRKNTPYSRFRDVPDSQNPTLSEGEGGPRTNNQTQPGDSLRGSGSRKGARGADEQSQKPLRDDDSDDDNLSGSSGASDESPVSFGGVDSDFDLYYILGGIGILIVLGIVAAYGIRQSSRGLAHGGA